MTDFNIRDLVRADADYEFYAHITTTLYPDFPSTAEEFRTWDNNRDAKYPLHRYIIEHNHQPVGVLDLRQDGFNFHPQKWRWLVEVLPISERLAAFEAAWQFGQQFFADKDLIAIQSSSHESQEEFNSFLTDKGFSVTMRHPVSVQDLTTFDTNAYADQIQRTLDSGIEITTVAEFAKQQPDFWRLLWELENEIDQDIPTHDDIDPPTLASYKKYNTNRPGGSLDQWYIALDGGKMVGMTNVRQALGDPTLYYNLVTGVARSHRRRGIARALKVASAKSVLAAGGNRILTDNEENNPMYILNMQLGFAPKPAWLDFEKTLKDAAK